MGRRVVHAPESSLRTGAPIGSPLCSVESGHVAKPGETITCVACRRNLTAMAQWWNQLQVMGYKALPFKRRRRRGRKPDPRQTDFADLMGGE